jgi:hypothetical protein
MSTSICSPCVHDAFFQPLNALVAASPYSRQCPQLSDEHWLLTGVQRCLQQRQSGRAFLQEYGAHLPAQPTHSNYFTSLQSPRRLELLRNTNDEVLCHAQFPDHLDCLAQLQDYECFVVDGHWHEAGTHAPLHRKTKMPVGHFYSLNLRGHQLRHLATAHGVHENDVRALKRIGPSGLRHEVPKGKRVLIVYDRGGQDFALWKRCRVEKAVYFLSRAKRGLVYQPLQWLALDPNDSRNQGIESDQLIQHITGGRMRLIDYVEPNLGKEYQFLTNELDLPACVLVELYRRRWEVEKVFDEIKNKLAGNKAWGTSPVIKETQAQFLVLTHNLMLLYQHHLEVQHTIVNVAEDKRRATRQQELRDYLAATGREIGILLCEARRVTQCSVKFIRWLRHCLNHRLAEADALPRLRSLYGLL